MNRASLFLGSVIVSSCVATASWAADTDPRELIAQKFPGITVEQVTPSPVAGLYEVRMGPQVAYVSADGNFLVQGDIYDLRSEQNLTEARRSGVRLAAIDDLGESSMVIFAPAKYEHTISVFTDVDCGYCRKLHRQIEDYNARGIRVRYLFFPRSGPNTDSWAKAEAVWCSADRNDALTRAKRGEPVSAEPCAPTPVAQQFELGRKFGIQGTPAIITDTGELIGGYVAPDELADYLNKPPAAAAN